MVARDPHGRLHTAKLLSEDPGRYDDAAVEAIRRLTGVGSGPLPPLSLRLGTTVATNALLERRGEPTLLVITKGFGDALLIGTQDRPELFARAIVRPPPLYARVLEVDERMRADGAVDRPLDLHAARAGLEAARADGLRACAIVLVHGDRFPAHERALADAARAAEFDEVAASSTVAPVIKLVGRGDTTVVDAYLSPVLRRYVRGLERALGGAGRPLLMQSSGGLAPAGDVGGKDAVLSGPAGGVVGMAATAHRAGFDEVIGFDMGGTSTDVSHYASALERDEETVVGGARLRTPMLRVHTVAAGGGSVCRWEDDRLRVGPQSAGAIPGPAAYRRGGPLTLTDCNLLLGRLQPAHFPPVFGPDGDAPLDRDAAEARLRDLTAAMAAAGRPLSPEEAAEGCLAIAVADMAAAIKRISTARGHDVGRAVLQVFGGAGGQHACAVADALGMTRVMAHPLAGVLSAYGMGLADRRVLNVRTVLLPLAPEHAGEVDAALDALAEEAEHELRRQGGDEEGDAPDLRVERRVRLRTAAGDAGFELASGDAASLRSAFDAAHRARFGFGADGALVVDAVVAEAITETPPDPRPLAPPPDEAQPPLEIGQLWSGGRWRSAPVHARSGLALASRIDGPALIVDPIATTVVEAGWRARVDGDGVLLLERAAVATAGDPPDAATLDPVRLEIFAGLFTALAEEMGAALQRSAASVNIRERLDFSCALFDAEGALIANAPHIPVHLGSMGESVRAVIAARADGRDGRGFRPGDAYLLNDPYRGGTHLPDLTVISPVFAADKDARPAGFVAARGHHADVGGTRPGSMPADSHTLDEEGVLFSDVLAVDAGAFLEADLRARFAAGPWPARNVDQNIADLRAQLAACARGGAELQRLCATYGAEVVAAYMGHVQDGAERAVRALVGRLSPGRFRYEMDDGAAVEVAVTPDAAAGTLLIDFAGTSAQRPNNYNAPRAVVTAAVLYVVRTLLDADIPLNDGCLRPVTIRTEPGSMLDPRPPAAVVAGNVETSQVVTDALFGALGAMAAAQGTMNNTTFGDARRQYYETVAGGSGAGPGFAGADVVQTHMTNSRLTDPEILETRYPVLLEAFRIRQGSGGAGRWPGGCGAERRIRFLEPMSATVLSNRRRVAPFGLAGGGPGGLGANRVERADGRTEIMGAVFAAEMGAGDVLAIDTPGGGGFGPTAEPSSEDAFS